jgi:hypothetical protein
VYPALLPLMRCHTSAATSRLKRRLRRFKLTRPFRCKMTSGLCSCAITFQTQSANGYSVLLPFRRNSIFLFWTEVGLLNFILDHSGRPRMNLQPPVCMKTCTRKCYFTFRSIYLPHRPILEHPQRTQSQPSLLWKTEYRTHIKQE